MSKSTESLRTRPRGYIVPMALILFPNVLLATESRPHDSSHQYAIPREPLKAALQEYARISQQSVSFDEAQVRSRMTRGATGYLADHDALTEILAGTGFQARRDSLGGLTLVPLTHEARLAPISLHEVLVTAQKRLQDAQSVPLVVNTVSGATLEEYGETHLSDIAVHFPSLDVRSTYGVPGAVGLTIRGISTNSSANSTVATYVDGVPVNASGSYIGAGIIGVDIFPYDVNRIEVLEGPQGTLYGANSVGGIVNYVMREPNLYDAQSAVGGDLEGIDYGVQAGWGLRAFTAMPLVPGTLAVEISAAHQKTPGYITNVATGIQGINSGTQDSTRIALLWKPTDRLRAKFSALYDVSDFDGDGLIAASAKTQIPTYGWHDDRFIEPQGLINRFFLATAQVDYDLGWGALTSITGYSKANDTLQTDVSSGFEPAYGVDAQDVASYRVGKVTEEVRLASTNNKPLQWLAGIFYTNEQPKQFGYINPYIPSSGDLDDRVIPFDVASVSSTYNELNGFGNLSYNLTSRWTISAGGRYSYNRQTLTENETGYLYAKPVHDVGDSSSSATTYSFSTQYRFASDVRGYIRTASSYQPGGPNYAVPGAPITFGPDTLKDYEAGIKSEWFQRRVRANLTLYYMDWKNIQVSQSSGSPYYATYIANGPAAASKGVEESLSYLVVPGLKVEANGTYSEAYLTEAAPALKAQAGAQLPYAPRWSGNLILGYARPAFAGFVGNFDVIWHYEGAMDSAVSPLQSAFQHIGSYRTLSLSTGLSDSRWAVNLYARNLTNVHAFMGYGGSATYWPIIQPLTIGLNIDRTWQ